MKISIQVQALFIFLGVLVNITACGNSSEQHNVDEVILTGTDTEAAQVVINFRKALKTGDAVTARRLLADDVLILEGKGVERSADEYAGKHMLADIKYLQTMDVETLEHHVQQYNSVAISISRKSKKGVYKGDYIEKESNETIILSKKSDGWKITHIHWSQ